MSKKTITVLGIIFRILEILGPWLVGIGFIWLLGTAGTSDMEYELHTILHPNSWYFIQGIKAVAMMLVGTVLTDCARPIYRSICRANRRYIARRYHEYYGKRG